jgi:DNA-binding transcriptional LysR family regulator
LHLSQPAVTAQIKALEEEMGVSLFERYSGGVQLTEAGKLLLEDAQIILQSSQKMKAHATTLQGKLAGKARIGAIVNPADLRLGEWLITLVENYPLLSPVVSYGTSGHILNAVRKKELDAAFFIGHNPYQNVDAIKLRTMDYVVAAPCGISFDLKDWKALGKAPWLGISQFCATSKITQQLWREHNINPKKIGESEGEPVLVDLVCAGLGVSLLPLEAAQQAEAQGKLQILRMDGQEVAIQADLQFVYASDYRESPILQALLTTIRSVWQERA